MFPDVKETRYERLCKYNNIVQCTYYIRRRFQFFSLSPQTVKIPGKLIPTVLYIIL